MTVKWITRELLHVIHTDQLRQHGGSHGIRDLAAIESALNRPQNIRLYADRSDIAVLAASLGYGLCKNHGFVDGNKRVAFLALSIFLQINGSRLNASELDAAHTMLGVADGSVSEEMLAHWIRMNS